jgi:hypothetical protein
MYLNDPVPTGKGNLDFHFGGGTGLRPVVDVDPNNGDISYSGAFEMAPNIVFGGQYGLGKKIDLRFSAHFPYAIGGFGLRGGAQYSFLDESSFFNAAIGTDLGFVLAKDSIRILGSSTALDIQSNGAIGADLFIPLSFRINENSRIILTPRFSFNTIYIRHNENYRGTFKYKPQYPALSLGVRFRTIYLESTIILFNQSFYPNFGIAYIFSTRE